jgi:hypothetical protein
VSSRWFGRAALALLGHPVLWPTAVAQLFRLAPSGWWRTRPHFPVPDASYLRFRLQTQYGDPEREPEPADVVAYLKWCRRYGQVSG